MQLTLAHTLLLLPALTTATRTSPASFLPRDIVDSVKGFFGDPAALVRDLSQCMALCVSMGLSDLDCSDMDCACGNPNSTTTTNTTPAGEPGQAWEAATKTCFADLSNPDKTSRRVAALGCSEKDYEEGKALAICKAVGDKADKKNETYAALGQREWELLGVILNSDEVVEDKAAAGGNGTADGQKSGAAAGPGAVARITGAVLAAAVGYAVAML